MPDYYVEWRIDITASSPEAAARKAREIQLRKDSSATVFHVITAGTGEDFETIDLTEIDENQDC